MPVPSSKLHLFNVWVIKERICDILIQNRHTVNIKITPLKQQQHKIWIKLPQSPSIPVAMWAKQCWLKSPLGKYGGPISNRLHTRVARPTRHHRYVFLVLTSSPPEKTFILVSIPIWSTDRNVICMALQKNKKKKKTEIDSQNSA